VVLPNREGNDDAAPRRRWIVVAATVGVGTASAQAATWIEMAVCGAVTATFTTTCSAR